MEGNQLLKLLCNTCGNVGFVDGSDGFYYCKQCGAQAEDIIETGVADEDLMVAGDGAGTALYQTSHTRHVAKSQTASRFVPLSQQSTFWSPLFQESTPKNDDQNIYTIKKEYNYDDGVGPTEPEDFGSGLDPDESQAGYEDYHFEVRMKYLMGVQLMIQLQCEALVEKCKVCPLICGVTGSIWLRYVAATGVLDESWADDAINESETQKQGEPEDFIPRGKYSQEPHNLHGQRAVIIWFKFLRQKIPLSSSLAICYLACHVVREAVLPTDILKWSMEGKLPYFAAFVEIDKRFGPPSAACDISNSLMFRPSKAVPSQKLESLAASIAESIGLHLPPVNFYAIASRYLKELSLPIMKILPHALKIHEWSMPPELWLSSNALRLPARVCVMSILIVAVRILYNLNGFGAWEKSLRKYSSTKSNDDDHINLTKQSSFFKDVDFNAEDLLYHLEVRSRDMDKMNEYSKNLSSYLQYCKDVVFAGLEPPHDDYEETRMIEQLWNFYQNEKELEPTEEPSVRSGNAPSQKRSRGVESPISDLKGNKKVRDEFNQSVEDCLDTDSNDDEFFESSQDEPNLESNDETSSKSLIEKAIKRLKLDMEENRFHYISPRIYLKRLDYLHYVRKRNDGMYKYVAHADYYILLRACARVAKVDIRIMHIGVLSMERRLAWLENRIDHCLHLSPPSFTCKFCCDIPLEQQDLDNIPSCDVTDDPIGLSKLSI